MVLGEAGKLHCVDRFCYLGDMIGEGGGIEEATKARVRCVSSKFMELAPLLTSRGVSLKLKGKFYRSCIQRVLVYASETWVMMADDMKRLCRMERSMVRLMCGVTSKQRKSTNELMYQLGIEDVEIVVRRGRLRWFGHVVRKPKDDWVSLCRNVTVGGKRRRGRPRKTWRECVVDDMKCLKLNERDAMDRTLWRRNIRGARLTSASVEK